MHKYRWPQSALLGLACLASSAWAQPADPMIQLIDMLKQNGSLTEAQHAVLAEALQSRTGAASMPRSASGHVDVSQPAVLPPDDNDVVIRTDGGLEVARQDGEFSLALKGLVSADAALYDEDLNQVGSGTEIRKLRGTVIGHIGGDWRYELDVDFANNAVDVGDAFVTYLGWRPWEINVGQFKEPFSLEEMTPRASQTFMERSLPNVLVPSRATGIAAKWNNDNWLLAGGLFGEEASVDPGNEDDEGWSLTARGVYSPWSEERSALHLGLASSYRDPDSSQRIRFRTRPESHLTDIRYLNTGRFQPVDSITRYGLEGAWVKGPFSLQGEWMLADVDRSAADPLNFKGWYAQAAWTVTGESRRYQQHNGKFDGLSPIGDSGAFELAARLSALDLNDGNITGGEGRNLTLGANWYINDNLRVMLNYLIVDNDIHADDDGSVTGSDDINVLQMRLQAAF